jgi:hypothetical protein
MGDVVLGAALIGAGFGLAYGEGQRVLGTVICGIGAAACAGEVAILRVGMGRYEIALRAGRNGHGRGRADARYRWRCGGSWS